MIKNNYEFLAFTSTQVASQLWMECSASGMIDFCDVSAGGIQIRGHHKDVRGYCYGEQITIKYDFSNVDEAITAFVQMWRRKDTPEQAQDYKDFLADGERHGWD